MDDVVDIALRFVTTPTDTTGTGSGIAVTPHGGGNINDTYVVEPAAGPRFILQRINQHVFPKPQLIMTAQLLWLSAATEPSEKLHMAWKEVTNRY